MLSGHSGLGWLFCDRLFFWIYSEVFLNKQRWVAHSCNWVQARSFWILPFPDPGEGTEPGFMFQLLSVVLCGLGLVTLSL